MASTLPRALLLAVLLAWHAFPGAPVAAAQQSDSALAGPYVSEQAVRGEKIFSRWCVECHTRNDMASPDFQLKWNGRSALELFDRISVSMPENYPGAMAPAEYLDIVTYLLKLNGVPAGPVPLAGDSAALGKVRLSVASTHQPLFHHLSRRGR